MALLISRVIRVNITVSIYPAGMILVPNPMVLNVKTRIQLEIAMAAWSADCVLVSAVRFSPGNPIKLRRERSLQPVELKLLTARHPERSNRFTQRAENLRRLCGWGSRRLSELDLCGWPSSFRVCLRRGDIIPVPAESYIDAAYDEKDQS
jgi:hypothetical protein